MAIESLAARMRANTASRSLSDASIFAKRRFSVCSHFRPKFAQGCAAYDLISPAIRMAIEGWSSWPEVSEYSPWAAELSRVAGRTFSFADVPKSLVRECGGYDKFIADRGVVPTRSRNWHDLFNAAIWSSMPHTKVAIFQLQEGESGATSGRTTLQNRLTHFDERGVIVLCDKPELIDCIRQLRWDELFVRRRTEFLRHVHILCFGHAILEALLQPYVGLVAKALLVNVPRLPAKPSWNLAEAVDQSMASTLRAGQWALSPLPVLGIPGWYAQNEDPTFYANARYFRTRRWREHSSPAAELPRASAFDALTAE